MSVLYNLPTKMLRISHATIRQWCICMHIIIIQLQNTGIKSKLQWTFTEFVLSCVLKKWLTTKNQLMSASIYYLLLLHVAIQTSVSLELWRISGPWCTLTSCNKMSAPSEDSGMYTRGAELSEMGISPTDVRGVITAGGVYAVMGELRSEIGIAICSPNGSVSWSEISASASDDFSVFAVLSVLVLSRDKLDAPFTSLENRCLRRRRSFLRLCLALMRPARALTGSKWWSSEFSLSVVASTCP